MEGWQQGPLINFAELVSTGPFGSMLHKSDYVSNGVPLINPTNIVDESIVPDAEKQVGDEALSRLTSYVLRAGDVVVGRRGEIGRCAVVGVAQAGWVCGTGCFFIRPRPTADPRFLARLLRSPAYRDQLERASTGATMKNMSNTTLANLLVALPPIDEQRRIVAILDEAFEGIAAAKAKAEKNLHNSRDLFALQRDASFADGRQSWPTKPLGDVAEVQSGGTPLVSTKEFWGGDIAWYSSGELNDIETNEPERFITEAGLAGSNAKLFPKGALLVGMYDTAALKMSILDRAAAFNQAIAGVKPNPRFEMEFLFHALNFQKPELLNLRRGVRQKNLSLGKIKEIVVPVPSTQVQRNIVERLRATQELSDRLQSVYRRKLAALDELKKSLLHQAFAGALTAKSTNKELEAVA